MYELLMNGHDRPRASKTGEGMVYFGLGERFVYIVHLLAVLWLALLVAIELEP